MAVEIETRGRGPGPDEGEAEPIWDSILYSANHLDLAVGGRSFQLSASDEKQKLFLPPDDSFGGSKNQPKTSPKPALF